MTTEYQVITETLYWTTAEKSRRIQNHLNRLSPDGWTLVALDPVTFLGFDVGFSLVVGREVKQGQQEGGSSP